MSIKINELIFTHSKYGTWTYNLKTKSIGGRPLPSEAEAHHFDKVVIPEIEAAMARIMQKNFNADY